MRAVLFVKTGQLSFVVQFVKQRSVLLARAFSTKDKEFAC